VVQMEPNEDPNRGRFDHELLRIHDAIAAIPDGPTKRDAIWREVNVHIAKIKELYPAS
jgi:hypothetical protein